MEESLHDRYARRLGTLAVEVGANVAAGQDVFVLAMDVQQAPIARADRGIRLPRRAPAT